jgi:hypothetical protein
MSASRWFAGAARCDRSAPIMERCHGEMSACEQAAVCRLRRGGFPSHATEHFMALRSIKAFPIRFRVGCMLAICKNLLPIFSENKGGRSASRAAIDDGWKWVGVRQSAHARYTITLDRSSGLRRLQFERKRWTRWAPSKEQCSILRGAHFELNSINHVLCDVSHIVQDGSGPGRNTS